MQPVLPAAGGAGFAVRAEGRQPVRACRSGLRLRFQTARQPGDAELADPPRLLPVSPADQTGAAAGDARRLYPARRVKPQGRVLRRSGDFQTAAESAGAAATGGGQRQPQRHLSGLRRGRLLLSAGNPHHPAGCRQRRRCRPAPGGCPCANRTARYAGQPAVLAAVGIADRHRHRLHSVRAADVPADLRHHPRPRPAAKQRPYSGAGGGLRAGHGAHLHPAGGGGGRRRPAVPGGAAAPLRADRPVGAVYRASAVDVRPLFPAAAFGAANPAGELEQHPARRLADRRVPDGSPGRADLLALHHRAAQRHPAVYRPER